MSKSLQKASPNLWGIVVYFWPYISPHQGLLLISAIALLADVGLRLLEPWPLKFVFDYVLIGNDQPSNIPVISSLEPITLLTLSALAVILFTGLRALAAYWSTVGLATVGSRVMAKVRNHLYRHLQDLSLAYHTKARSGDLIIRVSSDASRLQEIMITAALPLIVSILSLLGMIGVMFWINPSLTLLSLLTLPLFWLVTNRLSQQIKDSSLKQRKQEGKVAAIASESITAIKLVKALWLQDAFAQVFSQQNQRSLNESVKTQRFAAHLERTVDVVIALGTAIVLWYGSWLALRDALTPGDVLVFITYVKNAFKPVQNFAKYVGRLAKAAASGERILDVLQQQPDIRDLPDAIPAPIFRGAVCFDHVNFGYEPGQVLLEDISLNIQPGQQIAIVGTSGSGKSTLVSLLLRLYDPTQGKIFIDSRDIREYTLASLRPQISVVLQESILFAATIRENIAYGVSGVSDIEIENAARLANAHNFIQALPQGYDTFVGERGATLSGGQRQRIAIARAAIRQTPILILDEPTTGLDKGNEKVVINALQKLSQNRTTLLITHDLNFATRAHRIVYMENGRVLEQGNHLQLMQKNGRYAALYQIQTAMENGK
ncbi:ABC transporter ATP-binding protein/permease [Anabaenopsis tanganyikae CS-531]|uniref:ABC transporter ATP-binding protein/permease n=2 Tax=Anabaenopsis TaxID=110103 RepID=A0ABT6KBS8_9CYAN|nr:MULTISPECIES: ABC transporter ATP-binding protein [Anabaenopsis]MDB9540832.1 ABC transporter ATP-binding protein [Anabaenopsis arnoldii]MDH6093270.1 ABC transporter ATP-binding protein/permease [Anabaenopsis arnoldii]MDH6105273.1 ABC transporter ATP-binding protein/permease [Anabaenopsis tanganyikae CS-531]